MSYRPYVSVSYNVNVNIGGLGLVLLAALGARSVQDVLLGGSGLWLPPDQAEPWLEKESDPFGGLLGGAVKLGEEVEIDWV